VTPKFKAGDMPGGIQDGVNAIAQQIQLRPEEAAARAAAADKAERDRASDGDFGGLFFIGFIFFIFFILPMLSSRSGGAARSARKDRPWDATDHHLGRRRRRSLGIGAAAAPHGAAAARAGAAEVEAAVLAASPAAAVPSGAAAPRAAGRGRRNMPKKISHVSEADHDIVTSAVAAAEAHTSGEIVAVVAAKSNDYDDVALVWASIIAFIAMSVIALFPEFYRGLYDRLTGGWGHELTANQWLGTVIAIGVIKWIGMWLILLWRPLRMALTPRSDQGAARPRARDRPVQGRDRGQDDRPHRGAAVPQPQRTSRRHRRRRSDRREGFGRRVGRCDGGADRARARRTARRRHGRGGAPDGDRARPSISRAAARIRTSSPTA
jgi:uncharacterized membrane protein YgcG